MPVRPLMILLTAALASGAQAAAERQGWSALPAHASEVAALIDGARRLGFDPGPQAGAGPKGECP